MVIERQYYDAGKKLGIRLSIIHILYYIHIYIYLYYLYIYAIYTYILLALSLIIILALQNVYNTYVYIIYLKYISRHTSSDRNQSIKQNAPRNLVDMTEPNGSTYIYIIIITMVCII